MAHRSAGDSAVGGPSIVQFRGQSIATPRRDLLDDLIREVFTEEVYDTPGVPDGGVIIDAGANIGVATMYFLGRYKPRKIIAIEPDPETAEYLRTNVAANGWSVVEVVQAALGAERGDVDLFVDAAKPSRRSMSTVARRTPAAAPEVRRVRSVLLSDVIVTTVELLKLDVEGAEFDVLAEAERSGALRHVQALQVELHHNIAGQRSRLGEVLSILEQEGFALVVDATAPSGPTEFQDVLVTAARGRAAQRRST